MDFLVGRLVLARGLLILRRRRTAIVRSFGRLLRVLSRVVGLPDRFAARQRIGQETGQRLPEVETARNIGADFVISGKVVRVEQLYVVTLKLHETKNGSLLSQDTVEGASQVDLMRSLREHARQLTTSIFTARR